MFLVKVSIDWFIEINNKNMVSILFDLFATDRLRCKFQYFQSCLLICILLCPFHLKLEFIATPRRSDPDSSNVLNLAYRSKDSERKSQLYYFSILAPLFTSYRKIPTHTSTEMCNNFSILIAGKCTFHKNKLLN